VPGSMVPSHRPTFYRFPYTLWGDYIGDAVQRSNHRSILADFPDIFSDFVGFPGAHELILPAEGIDADTLDELIRIGQHIRDDYPLYSDEDHSNLEMELADEAWDAYSRGTSCAHWPSWEWTLTRSTWRRSRAVLRGPRRRLRVPLRGDADSVFFPCYDADVAYVAARLAEVVR